VGTFDFTPAPTQKPQRIIAHVSGGPATGKTYLALTGKPPIYYINLDRGTEGVVEQFAQNKEIYISNPIIRPESTQGEYYTMWNEFVQLWRELCAKEEGTIVLDTMTVITDLAKNAHFGKTVQIPPNQAYQWQEPLRDLVRSTHDSKMNAVIIQRRGEVFGSVPDANGNKPTDVRGLNTMGYEAQLSIVTYRNDEATDPSERFYAHIEKCRHNMGLMGKVIPDPALGLLSLDLNQLTSVVHG